MTGHEAGLRTIVVSMLALALAPHSGAIVGTGAKPVDHVTIRTLDGKPATVPERGKRLTVLFFVGYDCPISNAYTPEMNRIASKYGPDGVAFYAVYPDKDLSADAARKHTHDFGYTFPSILDPGHKLVRLTGARVTPEVFVITESGKIAYHGRIDDWYIDFGKSRYRASQHDLRNVLDATLHGKPVATAYTKAVGCFISDP